MGFPMVRAAAAVAGSEAARALTHTCPRDAFCGEHDLAIVMGLAAGSSRPLPRFSRSWPHGLR